MKYVKYLIVFILISAFFYLTSEVYEAVFNQNELINRIDHFVLLRIIEIRTPFLNNVFINITSLGSEVTMFFIISFGLIIWIAERNYHAFFHLLFTSIGSVSLIWIMKNFIGRQRPDVIYQLIVTNGFSYPSGHSLISSAILYSIASIISQYAPKNANFLSVRFFLYLLIFLICFSRVYLGVHYLSDVVGGALLGIIYSLLLSILFSDFLVSLKKNV